MTDATIVIKGRSDLGLAVKQAEQQLKGLARQGELLGKIFRGGAIVGAAVAFERLAENAEKAAIAMGDKGAARSLHQLNKEIDTLKSKGLNVIGQVLGNIYGAAFGDRQAKLQEQISFLKQMSGRSFVAAGYKDIGTGFFTAAEGAAKLLDLEQKLALYQNNQPAGARLRAPGGRNRSSSTPVDLGDPKAGKVAAAVPQISELMLGIQKEFDAASRYFENMQVAAERAGESIQENFNTTLETSLENLKILPASIQVASSEMTLFADQAARNMQTAFADFLFDPFKDGLNGMVAGFVDSIRRMVAEAAAAQILNAFLSWGSGLGGSVGSFFSSIPRRAAGGPVTGGMPHIVGERGPELFVPGSSGSIVPNHALGGGISLAYNIDARGADAERIMAIMPGLLQRTKSETVAEVRNLIARGRM